jgi:hypothetical protein
MAAPIRDVYIIVGLMILFVVIIIIVLDMVYSVRKYRIGALLLAGVIKARSPLLGGAIEYLVRSFIWF